jgi:hypothetical protein
MPIRERILVTGQWGSSKSYQWLQMALALQKKGVIFRCIDTDDAIERMIDEEEKFHDLHEDNGGNVHIYPVYDWPDYIAASKEVVDLAKEGDWNIIDLADDAWQVVQDFYIAEIFKEDRGDFLLAARKKLKAKSKNLQALDGWTDWQVVNALYDDFIKPIVYRSKAHLYVATKADKVSKLDSDDTKENYGFIGVKPRGQKSLPFQVHTVMVFEQGSVQGQYVVTSIKDRSRPLYDRARLTNLFKQYLVGVAKWEM